MTQIEIDNSPLLRDCKASATSFWFNPQRFPVSFSHFLWQAMSQSIFKCFGSYSFDFITDDLWCTLLYTKKKFSSLRTTTLLPGSFSTDTQSTHHHPSKFISKLMFAASTKSGCIMKPRILLWNHATSYK